MPNKEITSEMIIKALEICSNGDVHSCEGCPFHEPTSQCISNLMKSALGLIKNKDVEIDILIRKKHTLRNEIAEKEAEIFNLKEEIASLKLKIGGFLNLN